MKFCVFCVTVLVRKLGSIAFDLEPAIYHDKSSWKMKLGPLAARIPLTRSTDVRALNTRYNLSACRIVLDRRWCMSPEYDDGLKIIFATIWLSKTYPPLECTDLRALVVYSYFVAHWSFSRWDDRATRKKKNFDDMIMMLFLKCNIYRRKCLVFVRILSSRVERTDGSKA